MKFSGFGKKSEVTERLLQQGGQEEFRPLSLLDAAEEGDMRSIEHHLGQLTPEEKFTRLITEKNENGSTTLHYAAHTGNTELIEKLFEGLDQGQQAALVAEKITMA